MVPHSAPNETQTYAELWADSINDVYDNAEDLLECLVMDSQREIELDGETYDDTIRRVLTKAAQCLRNGVPATFTGTELDLMRHMMPAHEVHQSGSLRWVREMCGDGQ